MSYLLHSYAKHATLTPCQAVVLGEYHYRSRFNKHFDQLEIARKLNISLSHLSRINSFLSAERFIQITKTGLNRRITRINVLQKDFGYVQYNDERLRQCQDKHNVAVMVTIVDRWVKGGGLSLGWEQRLANIIGCCLRTVKNHSKTILDLTGAILPMSKKRFDRAKAKVGAAFKRCQEKMSIVNGKKSNTTTTDYSYNISNDGLGGTSTRDMNILDMVMDRDWAN